ncbi:MAG: hypothetical protein AB4290_23420 [Spirulina sp.]
MKGSKILASLLLAAGATLLGTTVQAQILITGGTLVFFDNDPNTFANAPVAGYLETDQGRIQSADFSFEDASKNPYLFETIIAPGNPGAPPVLLQIDPNPPHGQDQPSYASPLYLLASGTAHTPNGPILFSGIDVTVYGNRVANTLQFPPITLATNFGTFKDVLYVDKYEVTHGEFGLGSTITDNNGNTVSLAPDNFHFTDPFPTPPPSPPPFTEPTLPPTEPLISLPIPELPLDVLPVEVKTVSGEIICSISQGRGQSSIRFSCNESGDEIRKPFFLTANSDRFFFAKIDLTPESPKIIRLIREGRSPRVTRLVPITEDNYQNLNLVQ